MTTTAVGRGLRADRPSGRAPKHPTFTPAMFRGGRRSPLPTAMDQPYVRFVKRGRVAIGAALDAAGVRGGDVVLVPSYHCPSMVDPVLDRGARPEFYAVLQDASIDLDDIDRRLGGQTRAIIVSHYFGFPQRLDGLRAWCDRHRVVLIEDCAHAFFGAFAHGAVASVGDYAIVSLWKFFALPDGGAVVSSRHDLSALSIAEPGVAAGLRVCLDTLDYAAAHARLGPAAGLVRGLLAIKAALWRRLRRTPAQAPAAPDGHGPVQRVPMLGLSPVSIQLMRWSSPQRIVARRRDNYLRMARAWSTLPGCRLLHAQLPCGVVPQVVPLYVQPVEAVFERLAARGVPMIRFGWELSPLLDRNAFAATLDLSAHVLQIVCHQELTAGEVDWIIDEVGAAVRDAGGARPRASWPAAPSAAA